MDCRANFPACVGSLAAAKGNACCAPSASQLSILQDFHVAVPVHCSNQVLLWAELESCLQCTNATKQDASAQLSP
eukprot:1161610-Pelagomonas_calceolata.AAC.7